MGRLTSVRTYVLCSYVPSWLPHRAVHSPSDPTSAQPSSSADQWLSETRHHCKRYGHMHVMWPYHGVGIGHIQIHDSHSNCDWGRQSCEMKFWNKWLFERMAIMCFRIGPCCQYSLHIRVWTFALVFYESCCVHEITCNTISQNCTEHISR